MTGTADNYAFLEGGGEMGALMRAHDWPSTPLGPIETWPQSLKTACGIVLRSPVAIVMLWGEAGVMIYNDAYSVFAADRHPRLFGSNVREGWPEVAAFNDNIVKVVLAGGTLSYRDMVLSLNRTGQFEDVYLDLDYSPVLDESGKPAGVIAIVVEITERVMAERRRERQRERLAQMFEQAPGFICTMSGPEHVFEFVNAAHRRLFNSADWIGKPLREAFPDLEGQGFYEAVDRVYATGERMVYSRMPVSFHAGPDGTFQARLLDFVYAPMFDDHGEVSGIFCEGYDVTDQGLAERALQDSQERLQLALDAADMGTFVWFPQEDRTEADAQMMALFSLPDDGLLNLATALADSILPEDGPRYAEAVARACDPDGPGQLRQDIRVRRPDGSVRWLGVTAQVYFAGDPPKAMRMAGAAVDITDRKLTEAALRESETRLRFLDALGRAVGASADADGILATTTRMVAEHLGVSICAYADMDEDQDGFTIRGDWSAPGSPSIVGHYSLADFGKLAVERLSAGLPLIVNDNLAELAPEEAATFQAIGIGSTICMPLIREGRLTALMAIHDRGPRAWTSIELATLTEVTERSWAHIVRVRAETDLRQSAEALRELNEQLEARVAETLAERKVLADLVESAEAYVLVSDLAFNLLAINRAAVAEYERAFGVTVGVGDNLIDCLAHMPEQQAEVRAAWARALGGEAYTEVLQFGDPSLRRQYYEVRFNILRDASGKQIGAYQFVYDVTERLRDQARLAEAQAALHQSQKMETVGQLTGGVAHDFNNLLMPIVGALDMLRGRLAGDERAQRLTNAALQAADRAQTLVQRLLAFSRRQHLSPRAVDVRSLIESMADLVSRSLGPRIRLLLEIAPDLPPAHVDPNQLELALLNLAVNARDAMGGEGTLTVRAQPAAPGEILGGAGAFVQISVTDTGVGMDAETLKRAIEPFFTTKGVGRGTGLGLSSVQGLAEQSGGTFRLTSTPGRGTTATLYLPVSSEVPAAAVFSRAVSADEGPRKARHAVILLVDDEDLVRAGAADMLIEAGYTVEEASSGYRAVQLLRGGLRPDAVVTDYAMPGMSGAELAREVRKTVPGVPVLMITGYATLTDREAGDLPRLAKPFRQADLVAAVEEIMQTAGAGAEG